MEKIGVLIVDDQALMGQAIRVFVDSTEDLITVGEANNGARAVEQCVALHPDVVLMDMQMPVMDGVEATRRITAQCPGVKVLAVTTFSTEEYLIPALRAGAIGYLLKDMEPGEIVSAVRRAHVGDAVLAPAVAKDLLAEIRGESRSAPDAADPALSASLSDRELEVLALLGSGYSNAEMATQLFLSEATVKSHMGRIMAKFEVRDRVQLLIKATQKGLIRIDRA